MVAVDVSVLAFAVNRFAPQHPRAGRLVETLANGELPWALPWSVLHEFLRLMLQPHAVARPLGAGDAAAFVDQLLKSPSVQLLAPGAGHQAALSEVLESMSGSGGVAGLETAVVLREHGVRELLSADRSMRRFTFLTVIDPIHGEPWTWASRPERRYRSLGPGRAR